VSNLVRNAVHHGEPPFEVVVEDAGTDVLLKVSNCGPPIAQEALNSMFEPFSQMTSTDGLGLGLFIVSEIVSAHGGSIDVTSGPGASTVFVSRWPRSRGGRR
jgi:signal transduction histidine kinase